jgi:hypothetical protein
MFTNVCGCWWPARCIGAPGDPDSGRKTPGETWVLSREELIRRFTALPETAFPQTRKYAAELTSGTGHQRSDFTLGLLIGNLTQQATPR